MAWEAFQVDVNKKQGRPVLGDRVTVGLALNLHVFDKESPPRCRQGKVQRCQRPQQLHPLRKAACRQEAPTDQNLLDNRRDEEGVVKDS